MLLTECTRNMYMHQHSRSTRKLPNYTYLRVTNGTNFCDPPLSCINRRILQAKKSIEAATKNKVGPRMTTQYDQTQGKSQEMANRNGEVACDGYSANNDVVLDLEYGDPTMYEPYWKKVDDECAVTIKASELLSYFGENDSNNSCFYQMPRLTDAIERVHRTVENAVTKGRYIIGGTGSSQLFVVALRAMASSLDGTGTNMKKTHIPVVCAEPYYSCYRDAVEEEKSEVFQWRGDANTFKEKGPYIEVVTSPNNPDGRRQKPVVNREGGLVISDLAYYWPQYTPITAALDHDVMLFTMSKATGHAGTRIGWAIVKDKEIATKMMKQMVLMTIGISHEAQLRATKILDFIADSYEYNLMVNPEVEGLFEFGNRVLAERWIKLRALVERSGSFSLPQYSPGYCNFMGKFTCNTPGFAWMESKTSEDAAKQVSDLKIKARSGSKFGFSISPKYVRVSIMGSDESFNLFLQKLSSI